MSVHSGTADASFVAIVPVKRLAQAKTRLALPPRMRRTFAMAFALDTITAVSACPAVESLVVVTADPRVRRALQHFRRKPLVFADEGRTAGLPAAVEGARVLLAKQACDTVVVPADLPALTPHDLGRALQGAAGHAGAFVRDVRGDGTTLLVRSHATGLTNAYGPASAERHRQAGFDELCNLPDGVRQDVDDIQDLEAVARLGVGAMTTALLARLERPWPHRAIWRIPDAESWCLTEP
jgi:2-phospho-L-lactate guanylyltransferase